MAAIQDVIIGTSPTAVLDASEAATGALWLVNESTQIITLDFAGSTADKDLAPGEPIKVRPGIIVTATSPLGSALLQILRGISPDHAQAPVDAKSGATMGITFPHHEIHEGAAYCACHALELGAATREYLITAPAGPVETHITLAVLASLDLDAWLFEDTTLTGGTPITPGNRNRNSANSADTTIAHTPSGSGDGNQMLNLMVGDPTGPGALAGGGASSDGRHEFILKSGAKYLLRLTSVSAGCRITVFLDWYEHTPKAA